MLVLLSFSLGIRQMTHRRLLGHGRLDAKVESARHDGVGDVEDLGRCLIRALILRQIRRLLVQRNAGERISLGRQLCECRLLRAVVGRRSSSIAADLTKKGGEKSRSCLTAHDIGAGKTGQSRSICVPGRSFARSRPPQPHWDRSSQPESAPQRRSE